MFKGTILALAALGVTEARVSSGGCPKVEMMDDLDETRYTGKWFEWRRDYWNTYTQWAECVTKEFAMRPDGNVDLAFRAKYPFPWGYRVGDGVLYSCDKGKCKSYMGPKGGFEATMGDSDKRANFDFFFTDYENVDIGYSCTEMFYGWFKNERLSIAGRTAEIDEEVMDYAKAII